MQTDIWPVWSLRSLLLCLLVTGVSGDVVIPAFDTSVHIDSAVSNMDNLALESKLQTALVGADGSVPGDIHYTFSVSGANKSEIGGATGMVRSKFVVSSLEGWDTLPNASSEREWRDSTEITGTIVNFLNNFDYASGIRI